MTRGVILKFIKDPLTDGSVGKIFTIVHNKNISVVRVYRPSEKLKKKRVV